MYLFEQFDWVDRRCGKNDTLSKSRPTLFCEFSKKVLLVLTTYSQEVGQVDQHFCVNYSQKVDSDAESRQSLWCTLRTVRRWTVTQQIVTMVYTTQSEGGQWHSHYGVHYTQSEGGQWHSRQSLWCTLHTVRRWTVTQSRQTVTMVYTTHSQRVDSDTESRQTVTMVYTTHRRWTVT